MKFGKGLKLCFVLLTLVVSASFASATTMQIISEVTPDGILVRSYGKTNFRYSRIEVSPSAEVYVSQARWSSSDWPSDALVFSDNGTLLRTLSPANLATPYGFGFDNDGNAYLASSHRLGKLGDLAQAASIYKFSPTGALLAEWQPGGAPFGRYADIEITSTGRIFVSTWHGWATGSPQMYELNSAGNVVNSFSSTGNSRRHDHTAISDVTGHLFAMGRDNGSPNTRWREFALDGTTLNVVDLGTDYFAGLEIDSSGNIYTFNRTADLLQVFSPNGTLMQNLAVGLPEVHDFTFAPNGNLLFINDVPEPATLGLLLIGGLAMVIRRRK